MADQTEQTAVETAPTPAAPAWVGLVTWAALAIVVLVALQIAGFIGQAVALGSQAKTLNFSDRLGYSFLQNLDQAPIGFEMFIAVLLTLAPAIARRPTSRQHDRIAQYVLVATVGLSLVTIIGGVIGVPARVHILHLSKQPVTGVIKWVLITFVIRNVLTAVLALVVALGAVTARFGPRRVAAAPVTAAEPAAS